MSDIRPPVPEKLEQDLAASEVTIQYKEGDKLEEASYSWYPSDYFGGVRIELRPVVVVTKDEANDPTDPGDGYHEEMVAVIPIEDVVSIEAKAYPAGEGPGYGSPSLLLASWHRDSQGQLRRFSPE